MRNHKFNPRQRKHYNHQGGSLYISEDELINKLNLEKNPLLLILDCIQDPQNLGSCLRSANGAGVTAIVTPKDKSVPVTETVKRVSAGGADYTPVCRVTNLVRFMGKIKDLGIWLVGTDDKGTESLYKTNLTLPTAIIMGQEGNGLRKLTKENCDFLVKIPMLGEVECLNVSIASALCLYEAIRQRGLT